MPWICPECDEETIKRVPYDLTPQQQHDCWRPRFAHRDGTQLCPVVGPRGYEPSEPIRR